MRFVFSSLSRLVVAIFAALFVIFVVDCEPDHFCDDFDACLAHHLLNPAFVAMVDSRCKMESKDTSRRISFTHLPKTSGSTVKDELVLMGGKARVQSSGHIHFLQTHNAYPQNIFVTMLRDPVSRAISYHSYVQQFSLNKDRMKNALWVGTHKAPPVAWAGNATIQAILATDPLGYFLVGVKNIRDHVSDIDFARIASLPQQPFDDTLPGTAPEFLQYVEQLPDEYRCTHHLQVAFILLKRYEVVGVVEKREDFYSTLFRRANLIKGNTTVLLHKNPTGYKITAEERQQMESLLLKPLFCNHVLWKMAAIIGEADAQCASNNTRA